MVRNGSLWSNEVFEKEVVCHSNNQKLQPEHFIMHPKAHKVMQKVFFFFFFHYSFANSMTNWVNILTGLLFNAYVRIHQVRTLVFDNYQTFKIQIHRSWGQPLRRYVSAPGDSLNITLLYCFLCKLPDTRPRLQINYFSRGRCHLLIPGNKTGWPPLAVVRM